MTKIAGFVSAMLLASPAMAFDGWHQISATVIPGAASGWDYIEYDAGTKRLFIGHRKVGLEVYDPATKSVIKIIAGTPACSANGVTLAAEFDLGVVNCENGSVIPFKLSTLEAAAPIKLGEGIDTSHYDPVTKRILVNMEPNKDGSTDAIVLEVPSLKQVGSVHVPSSKMEAAAGDGRGAMFVAARDVAKVFKIDMKTLKLVAEYPVPDCAGTNGLAVDIANARVFLGCRGSATVKPAFAVMDGNSGKILFSAEIGGGNDGVVYDADLKRIFVSNGVGAVLNVFEQASADSYKLLETLGTRAGVKVLAMDHGAKLLYSMGAEGSADTSKKILTTVSPFYANTITPNSFTVFVYGR